MRRPQRIRRWIRDGAADLAGALRQLTVSRAALLTVGAAGIAYGAWLTLHEILGGTATLSGFAVWWLSGPVVVDLLLMPTVVICGLALARFLPARGRRPIEAATLITALLALVAAPVVSGLGRRLDNPSLLDRDYPAGFAALVAIIWSLALGGYALSRHRPPRGRDSDLSTSQSVTTRPCP